MVFVWPRRRLVLFPPPTAPASGSTGGGGITSGIGDRSCVTFVLLAPTRLQWRLAAAAVSGRHPIGSNHGDDRGCGTRRVRLADSSFWSRTQVDSPRPGCFPVGAGQLSDTSPSHAPSAVRGPLQMGALDALKGAPRWMLSQPEPMPVLKTHRVLGSPIHADAHYLARGYEIAYFGAGCFWSLEHTFWGTPGVVTTAVGFQGGDHDVVNPSYRAVCAGEAGFAEVVKVVIDPDVLPYAAAVDVWLASHDPTTVNRQGGDTGVQYRSVVFCVDAGQRAVAEERLAHFDALLQKRQEAAAAAAAAAAAPEVKQQGEAGASPESDTSQAAVAVSTSSGEGSSGRSRRLSRPPGGVEGDAVVSIVADAAEYPFYNAELYHQQYLAENPWATCPTNVNSVYVPPLAVPSRSVSHGEG